MHPGYQLACAMWAIAVFLLALVALRLYTRIRIVKFVGAEDHMYAWTGVFFLLFTIFMQISVHHGLGQNFWQLGIDDTSNAIFWTYVANSFAITGNAMAKLSMGLFLLRVVQSKWHKIALWGAVIVTTTTSIALTIMLWHQTTPAKASWDPLRTPGKWNIRIQPLSVGLGENELTSKPVNFVPYFAWAGAEIAVAMVCIGIPTLRPLYLRTRGSTSVFANQGRSNNTSELPRFVMCDRKSLSFLPPPVRGPGFSHHSRTDSNISRPPAAYTKAGSDSVDEIISEYQNQHTGVIWVKNEVRVREDVAEWPLRN
ncbi:hypothetical protein AAE478_008164 [Parahypoxylon ruwenzoriense]